ncbi:MAG: tyrosine-protein phosphatase [Lentisphaeria bacterium]|nr:tyrosine-protein phosphatase [Lentisphaeria bacterium]
MKIGQVPLKARPVFPPLRLMLTAAAVCTAWSAFSAGSMEKIRAGEKKEAAAAAAIIRLNGPKTLSIPNKRHTAFINNIGKRRGLGDQSPADVTAPEVIGQEDSHPCQAVFRWNTPPGAVRGVFVVCGGWEVRRFDITGRDSIAVDNLKAGVRYSCSAEFMLKSGKTLRQMTTLTTADALPRWIRLPGASNVRDVGGWKTADGKYRVRQGLLYRGGEFDRRRHLTPEGRRIFVNILRIRTDLDLRGPAGLEPAVPEYLFEKEGVRQVLLPYSSLKLGHPAGRRVVAELFRELAKSGTFPAYIHCAGGADRTGSAVFLLLGVLGLEDEEMLTEFELTSFSLYGKRSRKGWVFKCTLDELAKYGRKADPLRRKAELFLLDCGVSQADIAAIRNIFLEKILPDAPPAKKTADAPKK